jgi:hypothetical protein
MTLFQDMFPDPKWPKPENLHRVGATITLQRARQLHAALAVRNYGIWSLILAAFGIAGKIDHDNDPLLLGICLTAYFSLFCAFLWISFSDSHRVQSVNSKFDFSVPTPRHLLEAIAIPMLVFGFVGLMVISLCGGS